MLEGHPPWRMPIKLVLKCMYSLYVRLVSKMPGLLLFTAIAQPVGHQIPDQGVGVSSPGTHNPMLEYKWHHILRWIQIKTNFHAPKV